MDGIVVSALEKSGAFAEVDHSAKQSFHPYIPNKSWKLREKLKKEKEVKSINGIRCLEKLYSRKIMNVSISILSKSLFKSQIAEKISNSNWNTLFTEKREESEVRDESKSVETLSIIETHSRYFQTIRYDLLYGQFII